MIVASYIFTSSYRWQIFGNVLEPEKTTRGLKQALQKTHSFLRSPQGMNLTELSLKMEDGLMSAMKKYTPWN